jgi:hypothetical protein
MRAEGLQRKAARWWKHSTIPDPAAPARADLIRHIFTAGARRLNPRWCDVTYSRHPGTSPGKGTCLHSALGYRPPAEYEAAPGQNDPQAVA